MLQQKIINILGRLYHITPSEAHTIWFKAQGHYDQKIADIIMSIIRANPEGLPVLKHSMLCRVTLMRRRLVRVCGKAA